MSLPSASLVSELEGFVSPVAEIRAVLAVAERSAGDQDTNSLIDQLTSAGAFRLTREGAAPGATIDVPLVIDVIFEIARVSPSVAHIVQAHYSVLAALPGFVPLLGKGLQQLPHGRFVNLQSEGNGAAVGNNTTNIVDHYGELQLSGSKEYVTGIETADWLSVGAVFDGQKVIVLLPRDTPGIEVEATWDAFGQADTHSNRVRLDRIAVDPGAIYLSSKSLGVNVAKLAHAAIDLGIAESALADFAGFLTSEGRLRKLAVEAGVASVVDDPLIARQFAEWVLQIASLKSQLGVIAQGTPRAVETGAAGLDPLSDVFVRAFHAYVGDVVVRLTSDLFANAGAHAALAGRRLDRHWRDARVHSLIGARDWTLVQLGRAVLHDRAHGLDGH